MSVEILRTLVLGTGHLSPGTAARLHAGDTDEWAPQISWDYGWDWYVPTDDEYSTSLFPPEILAAFALARQHDCSWVRYDQDGPTIDGLPFHEW